MINSPGYRSFVDARGDARPEMLADLASAGRALTTATRVHRVRGARVRGSLCGAPGAAGARFMINSPSLLILLQIKIDFLSSLEPRTARCQPGATPVRASPPIRLHHPTNVTVTQRL